MPLEKKLQLKPDQKISIIGNEKIAALKKLQTAKNADALLVFVESQKELAKYLKQLQNAAAAEKLTWVAYPKAKQLDADINRDSLHKFFAKNNLDTVRQIAIDDVWSALRLKIKT